MRATVERPEGPALPAGLRAHWRTWLGATDVDLSALGGAEPRLVVVGADARVRPGWDGQLHEVTGIVDDRGSAVVSVPPQHAEAARAYVANGHGLDELRRALPGMLGKPDHLVFRGVCRWSVAPPSAEELPDAGRWLPSDDERVPDWLEPFGGNVLVTLDEDDRYLAGVGLKRHDRFGHEISVGTDERARGRGLARRLVAQASRSLHADGIVPTYLHDPANTASAKVADAAGFPDRGWGVLGLFKLPD